MKAWRAFNAQENFSKEVQQPTEKQYCIKHGEEPEQMNEKVSDC